MPNLPRLKPDPIPPIRAVPEQAAQGQLAKVYARTRQGLGVPWMGVVAMAFAQYPRFYDALWSALEPVAGTADFATSCHALRTTAEAEAAALAPRPLCPDLRHAGYDDTDIAEIRACNEVFSAGNMPYVLMASLARLLLDGLDWPGAAQSGLKATPPMSVLPRPPLIEPHHADPTMAALYADLRQTLGLPFVNTDYRAFARWPSYFAPAWSGLKTAVLSPSYEAHVTRIHDHAITLAADLPNVTRMTADRMQDAAKADGAPSELRDVVHLFQWLLPGLALNVAVLRAQLRDGAP